MISRHQALLTNIRLELNQAQAVRILGPEKVKDLSFFQGGDPLLAVDPAIDLSLISNKSLNCMMHSANQLSLRLKTSCWIFASSPPRSSEALTPVRPLYKP